MEKELLQQERDLFFEGPVVLFHWSISPELQITYVSDNVYRVFGYTPEEFTASQTTLEQVIEPTDYTTLLHELHEHKDSNELLAHKPFRWVNKQGETLWVFAQTLVRSENNKLVYLSYLMDNTVSHNALEAQRASEVRYKQMFETNLAVKLLIDPETGAIIEANPSAIEFYQYPKEVFTQMNIHEINMLSKEEVSLELERAKTEERLFFNFRHRLASGEIRDVEVYTGPVTTPHGNLLHSIIHDVTERNLTRQSLEATNRYLDRKLGELESAQDQMVRRERLAAVGQLTTGIAHDFNNILTGIMGFAEMLQMSTDTPKPMMEDLGQIVQSGERAAKLIRQLLDFSRKSIQEFHSLDLYAFLDEVVTFLRRTIPENISLSLEVEPGTYTVQADPTQLQQVLTNLAVNARDAMIQGGQIFIHLSHVSEQGESHCTLCGQAIHGQLIRLVFRDTGPGIPQKIIKHVLEPFFTTKEVGKGSGLGLSQVAGIIVQHKGHMAIQSQKNKGSTFAIYLHPSQEERQPRTKLSTPTPLRGKGQLILLVEDDPTVRRVSHIMLEKLGYQVLIASDGKEAIEIYHKHTKAIDLILSDMVMPEVDGITLFHTLKEEDPDLQLVFMSGYPLGEDDERLQDLDVAGWIQKPMSLQQLSEVIHHALES